MTYVAQSNRDQIDLCVMLTIDAAKIIHTTQPVYNRWHKEQRTLHAGVLNVCIYQ